MLIEFTR